MQQVILPEALDFAFDEIRLDTEIEKYRNDPVLWAKDIAGIELWSKQRDIARSVQENQRSAIRAANGVGKDLWVETPIPTPTGWTKMGDIQPGDYVLDEMGRPAKVTHVSPVMHNTTFKITFNDGVVMYAGGDHLWNTIDFKTIQKYRKCKHTPPITDYRELWDLSETRDTYTIKATPVHYIPINASLDLPEQDLPLDPYVFGTQLGNKRIPMQYLRASHEQRLNLLRGIMDSNTMNNDVVELVRSLGVKCSTNKNSEHDTVRTIVSVEQVPTLPSKCIVVDSPRHMYLSGEAMVPTHNSLVASVLASWFIAVNDPHDTIIITTAPSFPQIKSNMFYELQARKRQIDLRIEQKLVKPQFALPGRIITSGNVAEWKLPTGEQLVIGRKPAEGDIITTFQGIHRKNVLFIIDEAGGMPVDMFVAAERMTTNKNAKILAIGNPDRRGSEFFRMFFDPDVEWRWAKLHISSYDTPAFTGEPCAEELLQYLPNQEWVESNLRAWGGPSDPRAKISILGEFPDSDESVFFSESAMGTADDTDIDVDLTMPRILGVDLSMWGSDESVAYINQDNKIRRADSWGQLGTQATALRIHDLAVNLDIDYVNIDAGGIGAPIIDVIKTTFPESTRNYRVVEMNASAVPPDKRRWYNARAWWYDRLREDMILGKVDLELPRGDNRLRTQMTAINYFIAEGSRAGSIQMESKREMKKRVGYSPDEVDAVVFAHMTPDELLYKEKSSKSVVYDSPSEVLSQVPNYLQAIESIFV